MVEDVRHSVCIVTYERAAFLQRCLRSLDGRLHEGTQVVVVDASERDAGELVLKEFTGAVYLHRPSLAGRMTTSRNEALSVASGTIISFIDDDVVVSREWQDALLHAFEDPTVSAVCGRTRNLQPGEDDYGRPVGRLLPDGTLTEGFASSQPDTVDIDHGIGANMSMRRAALAELGGFRDDYPGTALREDSDVFLRLRSLGRRAVFAPHATVDHLPAPHVKGRRFDLRYKLYARRNHMVLIARHAGIASPMLRHWIGREFAQVPRAGGVGRTVQRAGVTALGVAWGALAMTRQACWRPTPPARTDVVGRAIRERLQMNMSSRPPR